MRSLETVGDINKSVWIFLVKDSVTDADIAPYEIIEFLGGMFAWINNSDIFEYGDFPKSGMCNMPNPDGVIDTALNKDTSNEQ